MESQVPLDDKEQEILDEIERQFMQDDPKLAKAVLRVLSVDVFRRTSQRAAVGLILGLVMMLVFFLICTWVAMVGFGIMGVAASFFVVAFRRKTTGRGPSSLGWDRWVGGFRSKWRR